MAYLTERVSTQKITTVTIQTNKPQVLTDSQKIPAEQNNVNLSSDLNNKKNDVINLLSNFPATALWLLNKHEQVSDELDFQEDDSNLKSDLANALGEIQKYFSVSTTYYGIQETHSSAFLEAKNNLSLALQLFPFTFEELNQLVDMIVYAFKYRGLSYQSTKNNDFVLKRLEGSRRPNRLKSLEINNFFANIKTRQLDEEFLFSSTVNMQQWFFELVNAEHQWLAIRQKLAATNSKLVLFIANQYKSSFLEFDDLVQEGQTGLLKAVDRFDHRLGFQFSTYAGYWIRQAISRALSRCERVVRIPCGQVATINKVYRAKEELINKTGQEPSVKELSDYTSIPSDELNNLLCFSQLAISLELSEQDDENAFAPIDFLEQQIFTHAFNKIAKDDLDQLLNKSIESLTPREASIICSHFGLTNDQEMTLQEIGSELNLTRERIRQIQVAALNKIKLNFGSELMCFL